MTLNKGFFSIHIIILAVCQRGFSRNMTGFFTLHVRTKVQHVKGAKSGGNNNARCGDGGRSEGGSPMQQLRVLHQRGQQQRTRRGRWGGGWLQRDRQGPVSAAVGEGSRGRGWRR